MQNVPKHELKLSSMTLVVLSVSIARRVLCSQRGTAFISPEADGLVGAVEGKCVSFGEDAVLDSRGHHCLLAAAQGDVGEDAGGDVKDITCSVCARREREDAGRGGGGCVKSEGSAKTQDGFSGIGDGEVEAENGKFVAVAAVYYRNMGRVSAASDFEAGCGKVGSVDDGVARKVSFGIDAWIWTYFATAARLLSSTGS